MNKIVLGNCVDELMKLEDESVDAFITSPPYDNLRDYNGYSFPFEAIAKAMYQKLAKGGVIVWVVGDAVLKGSETGSSFRQAIFFQELGLNIHDTMIYEKNDDHIDGVFLVFFQLWRVVDFANQAIHPCPNEAAGSQFIKNVDMFTLTLTHNWR